MTKKREDDSIRISFKKTEYEQKLRRDIISASKQMGKSSWIKILCAKELYHNTDQNNNNNNQTCNNNYSNTSFSDINLDINTSSF